MARIDKLRQAVEDLYEEKREGRSDWCDWLYTNHVFIVARSSVKLAQKYGANPELCEAAALMHDIADTRMPRLDVSHKAETLKIARELMLKSDYTKGEIAVTVDDAIRFHGCEDDNRPKSIEGLVLATADALAHLNTDVYIHAIWAYGREKSLADTKAWALKKLKRDMFDKIAFDDERGDARESYEAFKLLFSR